jgi:hypothetical protein
MVAATFLFLESPEKVFDSLIHSFLQVPCLECNATHRHEGQDCGLPSHFQTFGSSWPGLPSCQCLEYIQRIYLNYCNVLRMYFVYPYIIRAPTFVLQQSRPGGSVVDQRQFQLFQSHQSWCLWALQVLSTMVCRPMPAALHSGVLPMCALADVGVGMWQKTCHYPCT